LMQNSNKQIAFGTIMSYLSIVISCVGAIVVTPFIVKCLGDSSYGVYRIIVSLIAYMSILNFGFGSSAVRYISEFRVKNQKEKEGEFLTIIKYMNFFAICICVIVGVIIYSFIGDIFSSSLTLEEIDLAKELFKILIIGVIVSVVNDIYASIINAYEQFIFVKSIDVIRNILKIVLVFMILSFNSSAVFLTMIDLALNVFVLLSNMYYVRFKLKIVIAFRLPNLKTIDFKFYKEVFVFASLVLLNIIINQLIWNTDSIIIGMRLDSVSAAIYGVGATISSMFYNMSLVIGNLLMPKTVFMVKSGATKSELTDYMIKVARIQAFIIFFIVSAYFVMGKQFVQLWMGNSYSDAWISSLLVMIGSVFASLLVSGHAILKAMNKQNFFMGTYFIIFLLNAVITYALVVHTGIIGAAAVTMVTFVGGTIFILIPYYHISIKLNMKKFISSMCRDILPATLVVAFVMWKFYQYVDISSWVKFFVMAAVYTVVYYLVIYFCGTTRKEKDIIQSIIIRLGGRKK
jgi:O-antigen/teichoic acid export membrane protein